MDEKISKEAVLVVVGSFIGGAMGLGLDELRKDVSSITNWLFFAGFLVLLFLISYWLLTLTEKRRSKRKKSRKS